MRSLRINNLSLQLLIKVHPLMCGKRKYNKMDIYEQAEQISNQQDFIEFLKILKKDFIENTTEWENDDLMSFLNGLEGYNIDKPQAESSWKVFAEILISARVYE